MRKREKWFNMATKNIFIGVLFSLVLVFSQAYAEKHYIFRWGEGEGFNWPGWEWCDGNPYFASDFGAKGWRKNDGAYYSGGTNWFPRIAEKTDYEGVSNLSELVVSDRAPSTSEGGCLRIYEDTDATTHQCCYWFLFPDNYLNNGFADLNTNRLSFYVKVLGMQGIDPTSRDLPVNMHFGTYLCSGNPSCCWAASPHNPTCANPGEGPGNRHYYHYLGIDPGAWVHVLLDQMPTHHRGHKGPEEPQYPIEGYFQDLASFYFEIRQSQSVATQIFMDEIYTYDEAEPQNDLSVTSLWIGYWPNDDYWEIGWEDCSFVSEGYNDNSHSTFEIRWSTQPITNDNYASAQVVSPMFFCGTAYTGEGENLIRRPNSWVRGAWTRFRLPDDIEQNYNHIYFAVKDVSVAGAHIGTQWPYNRGDGHDAPSQYIHTIDYYLRPDSYADEDVNQDGSVNVSDVQLVVNVILGNATNDRADVNGDERVTISDVQEVVNGIIS